MTLHGWNDVFVVFYGALILGVIILLVVAYGEEKKIRRNRIENEQRELELQSA